MSTIIFDFDGTIADTFKRALEIAAELTGTTERVTPAEIARLRGMSAYQVIQELRIHPWKMPFLVSRGRKKLREEMDRIRAVDGMPRVIKQLKASGHELYIVSSNSEQNIKFFLKQHDLEQEFAVVDGGAGIFRKARRLRHLIKRNKLDADDVFYVGDEVRDIEAAKHAGVRIISVTWGYNNMAALVAHHPDFVARKPADIPKLVK